MRKLKILYEDNHIIVVEKPPNVPSQADKTTDEDMLTIIKKYINHFFSEFSFLFSILEFIFSLFSRFFIFLYISKVQ